jgi:hypothetical protein
MEAHVSDFGKRKGGGRRAAKREYIPLIAVTTTITGSKSACLVDVSCTGARLQGLGLPRPDEVLEICIEGVRAFGLVTWTNEHQCGVAFDVPLSTAEVTFLRQKVAVARGLPMETQAALDDWVTGLAR